ncbi:hypothetical protein M885DRAFT_541037 [Pelagophyceae sp. CCMP2097]|nr:hypothetical protein M885DRAFT_541037 [Pelagophyceae sp. CCMP2097]|mmetsp:Transcript_1160/g.4316  ORF Transcript_1160/g.4316 Transcript_1160/m.4316 type:complete len:238 (+) Transcript_1160:50-763(+)
MKRRRVAGPLGVVPCAAEGWRAHADAATAAVVVASADEADSVDVLRYIAAGATQRLDTEVLRRNVRADPYGELDATLARKIAARLAVGDADRLRSSREVRMSTAVDIATVSGTKAAHLAARGAPVAVRLRRLVVDYSCFGDRVSYRAALHTESAIRTVLRVELRLESANVVRKRVAAGRRGLRALAKALGMPLHERHIVFFLLSCDSLYDNEFGVESAVIEALFPDRLEEEDDDEAP